MLQQPAFIPAAPIHGLALHLNKTFSYVLRNERGLDKKLSLETLHTKSPSQWVDEVEVVWR